MGCLDRFPGLFLLRLPYPGHELFRKALRYGRFLLIQGVMDGYQIVKVPLAGRAGGHMFHQLRPVFP